MYDLVFKLSLPFIYLGAVWSHPIAVKEKHGHTQDSIPRPAVCNLCNKATKDSLYDLMYTQVHHHLSTIPKSKKF